MGHFDSPLAITAPPRQTSHAQGGIFSRFDLFVPNYRHLRISHRGNVPLSATHIALWNVGNHPWLPRDTSHSDKSCSPKPVAAYCETDMSSKVGAAMNTS